MVSHKINFTKAAINNIIPPIRDKSKKGGVYDTYYDLNEKGLVLIVSNGGVKSFYLYAKINGKPVRVQLGKSPEMTIEQARKAATHNRSMINNGLNPNDEKKKRKSELTFGELFEQYMERYSKKEKRSWQYDEREVNKYLPHWLKRKVSSISNSDVRELHEKMGAENGIYQANRILERIRAIYNKGIEWGLDIANPTQGIKKYKEQSRDRFLQSDELPHFWQALTEEGNEVARDYLMISLFTGARKSNVLAMRWEEINFSRKEWRIPQTKNGDALSVPLTDEAVQILQHRKSKTTGAWVFSSNDSATGHLADPQKAWRRIRQKATIAIWEQDERLIELIEPVKKRMNYGFTVGQAFKEIEKRAEEAGITLPTGVMDVRIHDLRRTMGSWQAITGATTAVIGKSLGHKSQQATAIYERLSIDPVRESMNKATKAMMGEV